MSGTELDEDEVESPNMESLGFCSLDGHEDAAVTPKRRENLKRTNSCVSVESSQPEASLVIFESKNLWPATFSWYSGEPAQLPHNPSVECAAK